LFNDPSSKESTALDLVPLTPAGFEILLDYIYSGKLDITADNCSAVLSAAICLQVFFCNVMMYNEILNQIQNIGVQDKYS